MSLEEQIQTKPSLRHLPAPSTIKLDPWRLITTKQLAHALGLDPACIATWTYRGIGPPQEEQFFRGSVKAFRIDKVQAWLAERRGEAYDQLQAWGDAIGQLLHDPGNDIGYAVRWWVETLGPRYAAPQGCRWQIGGFERYLNSLC